VYAPLRNDGSRVGVGTLTWEGSREIIDGVARGGEGLRGVFRSSMLPTAGCPIGREFDAAREVLYLSTCCTRWDLLTQARGDLVRVTLYRHGGLCVGVRGRTRR